MSALCISSIHLILPDSNQVAEDASQDRTNENCSSFAGVETVLRIDQGNGAESQEAYSPARRRAQ
jgi:hypothetical protein